MNRNTGMRRYAALPKSPPKRLPEVPTRRHPLPTGPDQATVLLVLKRALRPTDEGLASCCEVCGVPVCGTRGWDYSVHHRRGRDGSRTDNGLPNLVLCCGAGNEDPATCHGKIHTERAWSRWAGLWLPRNGVRLDPATVDVLLDRESRRVYLTADGGYADEPRGGLA